MSDLRTEARAASRGGDSLLAQLRRKRDRMLGPKMSTARLFCDEKDGRFRTGAVEWLEWLAEKNFVRETTVVPGDPEQTLINEGRRQAVLEILDVVLVHGDRLDEVNAQIKEIEHGR
jgi:hypothetical protein